KAMMPNKTVQRKGFRIMVLLPVELAAQGRLRLDVTLSIVPVNVNGSLCFSLPYCTMSISGSAHDLTKKASVVERETTTWGAIDGYVALCCHIRFVPASETFLARSARGRTASSMEILGEVRQSRRSLPLTSQKLVILDRGLKQSGEGRI